MAATSYYSPHKMEPIQSSTELHGESIFPPTNSPLFSFLGERDNLGKPEDYYSIIPKILEGEFGDDVNQNNTGIDAGWTYFGQFVSHDLTIRRELGGINPCLNLDCLYGFGPRSNAHLYEVYPREDGNNAFRGVCFALDTYLYNDNNITNDKKTVYDVFRIGKKGDIPVMADVRNDDNFLLNQLHCTFMRFHNQMAEYFQQKISLDNKKESNLFIRTRQYVTWTYQWLIVNEYLPLLAGKVANDLIKDRAYKILTEEFRSQQPILLPEFVAAAMRIGHSQVRDRYDLNQENLGIRLFGSNGETDLSGFKRDPNRGAIDWRFFFNFNNQSTLQKSRPIDLFLAPSIRKVPFLPGEEHNLGEINIKRSVEYGMVIQSKDLRKLRKYLQIKTIPDFEEALDSLYREIKDDWIDWREYKKRILALPGWPLWIFLLVEARVRGASTRQRKNVKQHLGPLGAQIIAEQMIWLLQKDAKSYLCQCPNWHPMQALSGYIPVRKALPSGLRPASLGLFSIADILHIANNGIHSHH